jgi:hypothetical protein
MTGSAPQNNQAVQFEQEQAAEADQKEAERQARLTQGQQLIDQIFNGTPVMQTTTSNYDWSQFNPTVNSAMALWESQNPTAATANVSAISGANAPSGYTAVQVPAKIAAATSGLRTEPAVGGQVGAGGNQYANSGGGGGGSGRDPAQVGAGGGGSGRDPVQTVAAPASQAAAGGGGGGMVWALKGPDGNIYYQGDPLSITTQMPTGQTTGGFDDAFYDSYKQKVLDYYMPDEQRQYDAAQRDLKYSLARAGTLQSSTAADKQGELAYNDALQKANIVANANTQEGNLKSQIQQNKQSLINQLYSTEDPTLTANLAESSAAASRLQDPNLTPAAALFSPALTTVGSAINGLLYPGQQYPSTAFGGTSSPTPAAANSSSDKLVGV